MPLQVLHNLPQACPAEALGIRVLTKACCLWCAAAMEGISSGKAAWSVPLQAPPISKPDQAFRDLGVEFVQGSEAVDLAELNDLFEKVH